MARHVIAIDRSQPLHAQPHLGHNRFHPDIPPVIEVEEGDDVVFETADALDGQLTPRSTAADLGRIDRGVTHPMTGPVHVKGAQPGDVLEVEFLDIQTETHGYTMALPGAGFLGDLVEAPFLANWTLEGGVATSPEIPGVRVPGAPFMGISAVAPSARMLEAWRDREARLAERGGRAQPPHPGGAAPGGACAVHGLRTFPPRENGGNFDVKQLTAGARLQLPVFVEGALFSTGDGHFAQGDGEVCITAIETAATVTVRFRLLKGLAERRRLTAPVFAHDRYRVAPGMDDRFIAAMGYPIRADGENEDEDLTLAARNALLNLMTLIQERGYTWSQAYVLCSVAADLKVSNVVDLPNVTVTAFLPEAVFD